MYTLSKVGKGIDKPQNGADVNSPKKFYIQNASPVQNRVDFS